MSTILTHARFLRMLLGAIGAGSTASAALLASGCGGNVNVPTGGEGGNGGAGSTATGASSTASTGGVDAGTVDCKSHLVSSAQQSPDGTCAQGTSAYQVNINCFAPPAAPATCDSFSEACLLSTYSCGLTNGGMSISCGPLPGPKGACCYVIGGDCAVGRPFTVEGHARLAAVVRGEGWREVLEPDVTGLDAATREALADAWGREALFEHASVASFARFAMELLGLGAPAELVLAAQQAGLDEHAHARACFGLASAYAGAALRPGALAIGGALGESAEPAAIAASLAREGCVAETVAALQVRRAAAEARDPVVKAALARIADEEAAHAALAWRALRWMLDAGGPDVRAAVTTVFAEADAHVSIGATTDRAGNEAAMRAHGYLPLDERRALAREALGRVVGPAAVALLATANLASTSQDSRAEAG